MEIRFGLISSDSHGQLGKDAYTGRMSKEKWGDRIPHVIEVRDEKFPHPVERWVVNGEVQGGNVCNCPTAMPNRSYYPQRWEEVPPEVYQPTARLRALDRDRIDAEVLFPNGPGGTFFYDDAEFELACVRAYNDALAEFRQTSKAIHPARSNSLYEPDQHNRRRGRARSQSGSSRHQHVGRSQCGDERIEKSRRSLLGAALGGLPRTWRRRSSPRLSGTCREALIAALARIQHAPGALCLDVAQFLHGHSIRSVSSFFRYAGKIPAAQLGFRGNRPGMGKLGAGSL